jgi:hypothetical protein
MGNGIDAQRLFRNSSQRCGGLLTVQASSRVSTSPSEIVAGQP